MFRKRNPRTTNWKNQYLSIKDSLKNGQVKVIKPKGLLHPKDMV